MGAPFLCLSLILFNDGTTNQPLRISQRGFKQRSMLEPEEGGFQLYRPCFDSGPHHTTQELCDRGQICFNFQNLSFLICKVRGQRQKFYTIRLFPKSELPYFSLFFKELGRSCQPSLQYRPPKLKKVLHPFNGWVIPKQPARQPWLIC